MCSTFLKYLISMIKKRAETFWWPTSETMKQDFTSFLLSFALFYYWLDRTVLDWRTAGLKVPSYYAKFTLPVFSNNNVRLKQHPRNGESPFFTHAGFKFWQRVEYGTWYAKNWKPRQPFYYKHIQGWAQTCWFFRKKKKKNNSNSSCTNKCGEKLRLRRALLTLRVWKRPLQNCCGN